MASLNLVANDILKFRCHCEVGDRESTKPWDEILA